MELKTYFYIHLPFAILVETSIFQNKFIPPEIIVSVTITAKLTPQEPR
jgi:hypothetical protein